MPSYLPVNQPRDKTEFMSHQRGTRKGRRETETDREDYAEVFLFCFLQSVSLVESCRSVSGERFALQKT